MPELINVYCDESCHLENDGQAAMVLGALWCPQNQSAFLNNEVAILKKKHNLSRYFEIKWTKVSASKLNFYKELIDLFFINQHLHFRAWIIPDKTILQHDKFQQNHDDWYYKMYFYLLRNIISNNKNYNIYIDIKDTRGRKKIQKLSEVLANARYDFNRNIINRIQHVHSHDIGLLQLADLLIGILSYKSRKLTTSPAKCEIIRYVQEISGRRLEQNTLPSEQKFNLCFWEPNSGNY